MIHRRKFLQNAALLAGGTVLTSLDNNTFAIFKNRIAPSNQLNVGAIGINGMGWANVTAALKVPGINLVALCDVDENRAGEARKRFPKARFYTDYRRMLDQLTAGRQVTYTDSEAIRGLLGGAFTRGHFARAV